MRPPRREERRTDYKKRCKRAVLVSPSRSGLFAFPLVLEHAADLAAWVPIAPVAPPAGDKGWFGVHAAYLQDLAKAKSLSVLAIFGEEDEKGRAVSQRLRQHFPGSGIARLGRAGHACYFDRPLLFHDVIMKFMYELLAHGRLAGPPEEEADKGRR